MKKTREIEVIFKFAILTLLVFPHFSSGQIYIHLLFITDADGNTGTGKKDVCQNFNDMQVICTAGICQNYSSVYSCTFNVKIQFISKKKKISFLKWVLFFSESTNGYRE